MAQTAPQNEPLPACNISCYDKQTTKLWSCAQARQAQRCCTSETKASNTKAPNKHSKTPCSCMPCMFLQGTGKGKINTRTSSGAVSAGVAVGIKVAAATLCIQTASATQNSCVNIHETRCSKLQKVQAGMHTTIRLMFCTAAERRSALEPVSCDGGTADTVHAPQDCQTLDQQQTQPLPGTAWCLSVDPQLLVNRRHHCICIRQKRAGAHESTLVNSMRTPLGPAAAAKSPPSNYYCRHQAWRDCNRLPIPKWPRTLP